MTDDLEALGRAVKRAQHRQHRALETALAQIDTTVVQWDALRAIERNPGASAHDLALATFQTDQSFGTLASRLEVQGWIVRRPGAGRRIDHSLTASGEQKLREAAAIVERVRSTLFAPLNEVDRQDLLRVLEKLLSDESSPDAFEEFRIRKPPNR